MYPEDLEEIKECPFCGSPYANKPVVISYYNRYSGTQYFVRCTNCDATSCHTGTEEEAIRKWNLRSVKEVE